MQLSDATTTIPLPPGLYWSDEFSWSPVAQSADYTLGGSLIVETAKRLAGRPITLEGAENRAWITRQQLEQLYAWASQPGLTLTLTLDDGRPFSVLFRHQDTAIESTPLWPGVTETAASYRTLTLRFLAT